MHKWIEIAFIPGCHEEAIKRLAPPSALRQARKAAETEGAAIAGKGGSDRRLLSSKREAQFRLNDGLRRSGSMSSSKMRTVTAVAMGDAEPKQPAFNQELSVRGEFLQEQVRRVAKKLDNAGDARPDTKQVRV